MINRFPRFGLPFNRDVRLYLLAWSLVAFGHFGIQGVLFNLYLLRLGHDTAFIGMLVGIGQVVWAGSALPASWIGARIGLRNALVTAHLTIMFSLSLLLFDEWLPAEIQIPWLFFWWIVLWSGAAMNTVNSIPFLGAIAPPERRNAAFSAQQAVMAIAGLAGAIIAGFLPQALAALIGSNLSAARPYSLALLVAPLAYFAAAAVLMAARNIYPAWQGETDTGGGRAPVGLLVFFGVVVFLQSASEGSTRVFFNVYLDIGLALATDHIGMLMGFAQLLPVLAAVAAPVLLRKRGAAGTYLIGVLGIAVSLLILALFPNWSVAGAAYGGVVMMTAVSAISRNLLSQEIVAQQWRTTTSAIVTIGVALGWATMAMAGGYLITDSGFRIVFVIGAALALSAAFLIVVLRRRTTIAPAAPISPDSTEPVQTEGRPA